MDQSNDSSNKRKREEEIRDYVYDYFDSLRNSKRMRIFNGGGCNGTHNAMLVSPPLRNVHHFQIPMGFFGNNAAPLVPLQLENGAPQVPLQLENGAPQVPLQLENGAPQMPLQLENGAPLVPLQLENGAPQVPLQLENGARLVPLQLENGAPQVPLQLDNGAPQVPLQLDNGPVPNALQVQEGVRSVDHVEIPVCQNVNRAIDRGEFLVGPCVEFRRQFANNCVVAPQQQQDVAAAGMPVEAVLQGQDNNAHQLPNVGGMPVAAFAAVAVVLQQQDNNARHLPNVVAAVEVPIVEDDFARVFSTAMDAAMDFMSPGMRQQASSNVAAAEIFSELAGDVARHQRRLYPG